MACSLLSRQNPVRRFTSRYRSSARGLSRDSSGPSLHCWVPAPLHAPLNACPPLGVPLRAITGMVSLSTHSPVGRLRIVPVPPGATVAGGLGARLVGGRLLAGLLALGETI